MTSVAVEIHNDSKTSVKQTLKIHMYGKTLQYMCIYIVIHFGIN